MVEYTCKFCKKNYGSIEEAENYEKQGLIGLNLEPGLLLSHKKARDGFKIFYKELPSEGHEKVYEFEEFLIWNSNACPVQKYSQSGSKFIESLKKSSPHYWAGSKGAGAEGAKKDQINNQGSKT